MCYGTPAAYFKILSQHLSGTQTAMSTQFRTRNPRNMKQKYCTMESVNEIGWMADWEVSWFVGSLVQGLCANAIILADWKKSVLHA